MLQSAVMYTPAAEDEEAPQEKIGFSRQEARHFVLPEPMLHRLALPCLAHPITCTKHMLASTYADSSHVTAAVLLHIQAELPTHSR